MSSRFNSSQNDTVSPSTTSTTHNHHHYFHHHRLDGLSPATSAVPTPPKYLLGGGGRGGGKASSSSSSLGSGGSRRRQLSPLLDVTNVNYSPGNVVDDDVFVMDDVLVGEIRRRGGGNVRVSDSGFGGSSFGLTSPTSGSSISVSSCETELSRGWKEFGHCRYGSSCQFAHGKEDLLPTPFPFKPKEEISSRMSILGGKSIHGLKYHAPLPVTVQTPVYHTPSSVTVQTPVYGTPSPVSAQSPVYRTPSPVTGQSQIYHTPIPVAAQTPVYHTPSLTTARTRVPSEMASHTRPQSAYGSPTPTMTSWAGYPGKGVPLSVPAELLGRTMIPSTLDHSVRMLTNKPEHLKARLMANANQERYWSPMDDGIQMLPSEAGECPSRDDVDLYIEHALYVPYVRKRLPAFSEIRGKQ